MLKFFRKIRYNLMETGKKGRYLKYAIGEIILVVIGILIALQINNWNENQKERIQEALNLQSFKTDLNGNLSELDRVVKKSTETSATVDSVFILYETNRNELYGNKFEQLALTGQNFTVYNAHEGTVNDIKESGNLNVIQNDSIRLAIGSWEANLRLIREWEKIEKDSWEKFRTYLHDHVAVYKNRLNEDILDDSQRQELLQESKFMNALRERMRIPAILNELYMKEFDRTKKLIVIIDKELGHD